MALAQVDWMEILAVALSVDLRAVSSVEKWVVMLVV